MLQLAKTLHFKFWQLLAWLLILGAILITLLRVALPLFDLTDYRQEIEQAVERHFGMALRLSGIHAQMRDARLALKFDNISLLDPRTQAPRIHFREAHIQINLLRSLFNGELILGRVLLVGGRLNLLRDQDGVFSINGFRLAGGSDFPFGPLLSRLQLRVKDCEIHWQDRLQGTAPMHLYRVSGRLVSNSRRHRMAVVSHIGQEGRERLQVIADLQEGSEDPLAFAGRVYVKGEDLVLAHRVPAELIGGVAIEGGRLELELWSEWVAGRVQRLQGTAELDGLKLSSEQSPSLRLDRFATLFDWHGSIHDWQLDLDRLVLMRQQQLWPPGRLSLAWQADKGDRQLRLGIDYLDLAEASHFAILMTPLGEDIRQVLIGLAPSGHLTSLRLALDQTPDRPTRWQVSGKVSQYSQQPWKAVPGLGGVNLNFDGNQDGGGLRLGSNRFVTDMPRLFRDRLGADKLRGDFKWTLNPTSGLYLKTKNLVVVTPDVETLSRLELHLPWDGVNPFIDMQTDFWDGDGAQKSRYLPTGIMPEALVDWLDRSLVNGHVTAGSMLLYGPLKDFPFHHDEGRFEVLFGIEDMVLDYRSDWPRLEEVVAEAHFLNNSLAISLFEGKILNSRLRRTEARIRRLKGAAPVEIDGSVVGPLRDLLQVLNETPLRQTFARFTATVAGGGQALTGLQLQIPLKKTDTLHIEGKVDFQQSSLLLKDYELAVQDLDGRLRFNEKQVWGKDIQGRLLDQPVVLQVEPGLQKAQAETRIRTSLTVSSDWLRQRFPDLSTAVDGQASAALELRIAHGHSQIPVSLALKSGLHGMAVRLPEPLAKTRQDSLPLDLTIDFVTGQQRDLHIAYADVVQAWLRYRSDSLKQGEVRFGDEAAQLPVAEGLRLRGSLPSLDLDRWTAWLRQQRGETAGTSILPLHLDLRIGTLKLVGMEFPKVRFQVKPVARGWRADFSSKALDGYGILPRHIDLHPLEVRLKQLRLDTKVLLATESDREDSASRPASEPMLDPRSLPALDLRVDALWFGDKPFGKASLQWHRSAWGIQIKEAAIRGDNLELEAKGYWHQVGNKDHSRFQLVKGHVASLGQLQEDLGVQFGIAKAPLDITGVFYWPQAPYALELQDLSSEKLTLKMGSGVVTEVDPGVGRLVGLLSLQALGKRLSLDFSDLFSKGLEFDRIEGQFEIKNGNAYTQNLIITSPSAQILIVGRTGLAARDYDQLVTVVPRVSSTLPLVGAIAGGPAVGVALVVTQGLFGEQVDRIIQSQYKLTGSWEEPIMKRMARGNARKKQEGERSSLMPDLPSR